MSKLSSRVLYGRGLNIAAQLNPSRKALSKFEEIQEMKGVALRQIGCGYLQSYYLLQDGRFIKTGYFMDSLTSIRIINLHRLVPPVIPLIQSVPFFKGVLAFKGGDEHPTTFNDEDHLFERVVFGYSRVFGINKNQVSAMGQNYFGQLGTKNMINYEHSFTQIPDLNGELISNVGCGFQHTLLVSNNGNLFGCGKASDYQVQPLKFTQNNQLTDKIEVPEIITKSQKVIKACGGLKFTLVWAEGNKLLAMGDNKFGQCGQNNILMPEVKELTEIVFEWEKDQKILDIACGFCHSLILTNKYVYFFGSVQQQQNPFKTYNQHICAPTPLPIENPTKIFACFDRSAIITQEGQAYIFGGRDYSNCGGESGALEIHQGFDEKSEIGLGFSHTLIYP